MKQPKPVKTIAMRVLEQHGIPYEPRYYEVEHHLSASEVAAVLGIPPEQTFKTLVVVRPGAPARPILALLPGDAQLDLRKLAAASGEKKLQMASLSEAERLTGMERGGISPLALLDRRLEVFIDETASLFDRIEISAGKVGVGILVEVEPLLALLAAHPADLAAAGSGSE